MQILTLTREDDSELFSADISERVTIGRAGACTITISDDRLLSKNHCEVMLDNGKLYIRDLGSTNHTYCEERRVSSSSWEQLETDKKYKMGKYYYFFKLFGEIKEEKEPAGSGTVFYKQMMDEFKKIAGMEEIISTKDLLMNDRSLVNAKFNQAIKTWKRISASKYILDLLCDRLDTNFEKDEKEKFYDEVDIYSSVSDLSEESQKIIYDIAAKLKLFTEDLLKAEGAEKYLSRLSSYSDEKIIAEKIVGIDDEFILYYLIPIFDIDEEELGYILKHVLKRKGVDFYNEDEFLLWISLRLDTDSRFGLLCELKELYSELKNVDSFTDSEEESVGTVYIGYSAEENYLDEIEDEIPAGEVRNSDVITAMLKWHIGIEKREGSSATRFFYELCAEVNELYAPEIAELKVLKKNSSESDTSAASGGNARGSYNVTQKYDGTGKIKIRYTAKSDVTVSAGVNSFASFGRFNRIDGMNTFALTEDVTFSAGSGEKEVTVRCTSEAPFQMAKLRKKGTASIAEKDTVTPAESIAKQFDSIEATNKPICIFFDQFKNTGDIRDYLYSAVDRKDLMAEWFYSKENLSIDIEQMNAEWFIDSKITKELTDDFASCNGYEQRCAVLTLLFIRFCKERLDEARDSGDLTKKFVNLVNNEMHEIRFEGISYGNPFDCLLCYLLLTESPVDNLRSLYKEFAVQ